MALDAYQNKPQYINSFIILKIFVNTIKYEVHSVDTKVLTGQGGEKFVAMDLTYENIPTPLNPLTPKI